MDEILYWYEIKINAYFDSWYGYDPIKDGLCPWRKCRGSLEQKDLNIKKCIQNINNLKM